MRSVRRSRRVPGRRVGRAQIFGTERYAVEPELHADNSHVIARSGRHGGRA
jgi:hypothetical protein